MNAPILRTIGLSKHFGGTVALSDVEFELFPGEIHGLIGENGAGKSTLTRILSGVHRPDMGQVELQGRPITFASPESAFAAGIVTVHQDVNLIESMSVVDNLFLNTEYKRGLQLDSRRMEEETEALLATLEIPVSPRDLIGNLPTDQRKMIQLARAIHRKPRVLLLDEPTSSLTSAEVNVLTRQVHKIAESGVAVLYISHYLNEVFEHTDRLTILRDGKSVWTGATSQISQEEAITSMIGKKLSTGFQRIPDEKARSGEIALEASALGFQHALGDISFVVRYGEVFGIGGLAGAGLGTLARALFGDPDFRPDCGEIRLDGKTVRWRHPSEAIEHGLALVTNDRHRTGALMDFSVVDNVALPSLRRFSDRFGRLQLRQLDMESDRMIRQLRVKTADSHAAMSTLSGGNQQKVMLAKWFLTRPQVLILDEPTLGVDVGAKESIRELIVESARNGTAVIVLTSELEEIAELCNRALILFRGRTVAEFDTPGFTYEDLTAAAFSPERRANDMTLNGAQ